jgi:mannose-6-phosphate isomerase-like protein (cupin superfamily)
MITEATRLAKKSLDFPDTTKVCDHGRMELVTLDDATITRATLHPGWKWSQDIRPMVHTDSCQVRHLQYVISGRLHVVLDDGGEVDMEPGDFVTIPPGHDAWVVGDEPFVCVDFSPEMTHYA